MGAHWLKSLGATSIVGLLLVGCGGGSNRSSSGSVTVKSPPSTATNPPAPGGGVPSEAQSAATGDIPDNQVFLTYDNRTAGYTIRYPEGWARKGSGSDVTFQDRANVIHVLIAKGTSPVSASGTKHTYTRFSAPDPVTGKRLPLTVDRYEYPHGDKVAIVDLSTPKGVDNVDAYRLISESFRWR